MKKSRPIALRLLVAGLVTILLLATIVGLLLLRGITLGPIAIAGFKLEHGFLQLERKLTLNLRGVTLPESKNSRAPSVALEPNVARDFLSRINYLQRFFSAVDIRDVELGQLSADFSYRENDRGHLHASGPGTDIAIGLNNEGDVIQIAIERVFSEHFGIDLSGEVSIDVHQMTLDGQLRALIADTLPVSLQLQADREQLRFSGKGEAAVTTLAPIMTLLRLGPGIDPWIVDSLRASAITLEAVSGTLPYDEPAQLLQTLRAEALVEDTEYTFAPGLEPALAAQTRVEFDKGVLQIYPKDATFYGQDAGETHVDIDFNHREPILSVHVKTRAQASAGILTLLEYYDIPFPYEQVAGLTDVDLTLRINLGTQAITAIGHFSAEDSQFTIGDQRVDVAHLDIDIETTTLFFKQLHVAMPGLFSARLNGQLDVGKGHGDLDIAVESFQWQQATSALRLDASAEQPLPVRYHFRSDGDSIDVAASNWHYADIPISIAAFTTAFDPGSFSGSLDAVGLVIEPSLRARVSGRYQAQSPYAALDISLLKLGADSLQLEQSSADIQLQIDERVSISSDTPVALSVAGIAIKLLPFRAQYRDNALTIAKSAFLLASGSTAALQGVINFSSGKGSLLLHDLELRARDGKLLFESQRSIGLTLSRQQQGLDIAIARIGLVFSQNSKHGWSAAIDDIAQLYTLSPLLQQLGLHDGNIRISSATGAAPYHISGRIQSPNALLMTEDRQGIHDYHFSGSYNGDNLQLDINRKLRIKWSDTIEVVSNHIGYSLPALLDIIEAVDKLTAARDPGLAQAGAATQAPPPQANKQGLALSLLANNSFIAISDQRQVPFDTLSARYRQGVASAKFHYGKGLAVLKYVDDTIRITGDKLDISVLQHFIRLAGLEGGTLEFGIAGKLENLHAAFRITDTIVKDYKHLNNMLAFVNTLPGLLTFNPPNYNSQGLPAKEVYVELTYKDRVVDVLALTIDSNELDFEASGSLDLHNETMDMTFNMISGAHKSVGRIPMLGFILAGDDKNPSITLKVTGNINDPRISNTMTRDVVSYPWQLIKRTVLLPGHILNQFGHDQTMAEDAAEKPAP